MKGILYYFFNYIIYISYLYMHLAEVDGEDGGDAGLERYIISFFNSIYI